MIKACKVKCGQAMSKLIGHGGYVTREIPADGVTIQLVVGEQSFEKAYLRFSDLEDILKLRDTSFLLEIDSWKEDDGKTST